MSFYMALITLIISVGLSVPPARSIIAHSMFGHMIVQMPLLVIAGFFGGHHIRSIFTEKLMASINRYGLTSFMIVMLIASYWMLPIAVDRAIVLPLVDIGKITSLLFTGFCLHFSMRSASRIVQVFFIGYILAMVVTLGIYFISVDTRLCNAYSQISQINTGYGLIGLSCLLCLMWLTSIKFKL